MVNRLYLASADVRLGPEARQLRPRYFGTNHMIRMNRLDIWRLFFKYSLPSLGVMASIGGSGITIRHSQPKWIPEKDSRYVGKRHKM